MKDITCGVAVVASIAAATYLLTNGSPVGGAWMIALGALITIGWL